MFLFARRYDMAKYELHELCKMFPEADEQTLKEMAEDIKENGQNEPIILYEGKILDGRNRLLACEIAGVEPSFIQFSGEEPLQFVLSKNLYRRHLSDSQRAMMAHKVWEMTKGDKETKIKQSEILEQFQVSQPLVASAGRIKKIGADSVKESIEDGTMTISSAVRRLQNTASSRGMLSFRRAAPRSRNSASTASAICARCSCRIRCLQSVNMHSPTASICA